MFEELNFYSLYQKYLRRILNAFFYSLPNPLPFYKILKRWVSIPPSLVRWLRFKGVFELSVEDMVLRMRSEGEYVETCLFWNGLLGGWEKISMGLWVELSKESNVIIDVGANTGIYGLVAKTINSRAKVIAFEPIARIHEKLKRNCELNKLDIELSKKALSNYDGKATLYDPGGHIYSVTVNRNDNPKGVSYEEVEISTTRLSSYLEQNRITKVDLIKMDVEGHEVEALEGFLSHLASTRPTFLIEITETKNAKKIESLLKNLDYLFFDIDEVNPPRRVEHLAKSSKWNFLLCQKEVADKLGLLA